jgi:MoaA/NifB/PqqE/SkfB family radical SAM enzyme
MDYMSLKAQNRNLNYEEARQGRVFLKSKPLFFWFDICGPCNLKCVHCGFQVFGRTSQEQVSEEVYSEVISELMPTAYRCNLGGTNWGEMTIGKKFHQFLLDAKKFGVRINLTTNGARILDDWFEDLLDTLVVIGFSMEGIGEEFEKLRGFRWRHFLKNVEKVCQGKADRNKNFRIEWRYCAHADSIHQLPDMIRLAKTIGVNKIQMMNLVPYVAKQKYKSLFYHRSLANHYFAEARQVAADLDFDIHIPPDFNVSDFGPGRLNQTRTSDATVADCGKTQADAASLELEMINCYRPWQACVVGELGDIRPCCIYWKPMGNIRENGFDSVWNGRKYRSLRASVNRKSDSICYSCRMPQFDNEENRAASQIAPTVKQVLHDSLKSLTSRRAVKFSGVMDKEFDPASNVEGK